MAECRDKIHELRNKTHSINVFSHEEMSRIYNEVIKRVGSCSPALTTEPEEAKIIEIS